MSWSRETPCISSRMERTSKQTNSSPVIHINHVTTTQISMYRPEIYDQIMLRLEISAIQTTMQWCVTVKIKEHVTSAMTCYCEDKRACYFRLSTYPPPDNSFLKYSLRNTGLFEMIVGVLTICHTQYTRDRSMCVILFNRTTLQVFVTYLIGALYVHPLWFYKHQHDNLKCTVYEKLLKPLQSFRITQYNMFIAKKENFLWLSDMAQFIIWESKVR